MKEVFTVKRERDLKDGFRITIGMGRAFHARNLAEVVYGLEHYFNEAVSGFSARPFDRQKHLDHAKDCDCCPFCREDKSLAVTACIRGK